MEFSKLLTHRWTMPVVVGLLAYGLDLAFGASQPAAILLGLGLTATLRIIHAETDHLRRR